MENEIVQGSIVELVPLIRDAFEAGKTVSLVVTGNSMAPLFHDKRDRVLLARCDQPRLYDILLFQRDNGQYALHRVVDIRPDGAVINGDAQTFTDNGITADRIVARVTAYARRGRSQPVPVDALSHRLYIFWWVRVLRPLRPYLFAVKGRIQRVFSKKV